MGLAIMTALASAPAHAGTVVERTVAFVNRRPILLSDVEMTRALLGLEEAEALERTIDEVLMSDEASRLVSDSVSEEEIATAIGMLREKAGARFTPAALRRKALAQLAISKYIDLRLRPLVRIEDGDVRKVFNEKVAADPLAPAFALVAPEIRQLLERQSLDQKIEEWVASLRRRDEVRRPAARTR
jgi:hypothetical protein